MPVLSKPIVKNVQKSPYSEARCISIDTLCDRFYQDTVPGYKKRARGNKLEDLCNVYRPSRRREEHKRSGDERLERMEDNLARLVDLGWKCWIQQKVMMNAMICASLPQIMQEDLQPRMEYLLNKFGVDELKPEVLIKATRRLGKTTCAALFITAYANSQPDAQADIYSVARRTSVMFLAKIVKLLVQLHGGRTDFIKKYNQEEFVFINECGTLATIHSYPAASKIDIPIHLEIIITILKCVARAHSLSHFIFFVISFFPIVPKLGVAHIKDKGTKPKIQVQLIIQYFLTNVLYIYTTDITPL